MSELVEFIRGCLDADEQTARAAAERADSVWEDEPRLGQVWTVFNDPDRLIHMPALRSPLGAHIARHDPARVLAEVNAKRAILDLHQPDALEPDICSVCASHAETYPCRTVLELAQPFRGEPGWRDEWGTQ